MNIFAPFLCLHITMIYRIYVYHYFARDLSHLWPHFQHKEEMKGNAPYQGLVLFEVPLYDTGFIWTRHHYRLSASKLRHLYGGYGLWVGRDFHRSVTRGLGFCDLTRRTPPLSRVLWQARGTENIFLPRFPRSFSKCREGQKRGKWTKKTAELLIKFQSSFACSILVQRKGIKI